MTKPLTKIPDIAYSIEGDLIKIEQSTGCGEFTYIEIYGNSRLFTQFPAETEEFEIRGQSF